MRTITTYNMVLSPCEDVLKSAHREWKIEKNEGEMKTRKEHETLYLRDLLGFHGERAEAKQQGGRGKRDTTGNVTAM
jgi:hypothetical protein